jgi:plastocyanin
MNRKVGFWIISIVLLATVLAGCSSAPSGKSQTTTDSTAASKPSSTASEKPAAQEYEIKISDFSYQPGTLTIEAGSKVTFTNLDPVKHTVTAKDNSFDSGLLGQGETFSMTFTKPGTYQIYCIPHPYMILTIEVK